ncbi:MAG: hypothetical protein WCO18_00300 [bacterium]
MPKNKIGKLGESLAIETYNSNKGLPNLHVPSEEILNVDAVNEKGERYSIKTVTETNTAMSCFWGLSEDVKEIPKKQFDYVVVIRLSKDFKPKRILELTWEQFLKHKKWNNDLNAWNLSLTKNLLAETKRIL